MKTDWLKRSQKTFDTLKWKIRKLAESSNPEEEEEKAIRDRQKKEIPEVRISFSIENIIKASFAVMGVIGLVYILGWLKSILILFVVALFLSAAFGPSVDRLERLRVPRGLGILLMYLIVLGIVVAMFSSLIPLIANEISELGLSIKDMIQSILNAEKPDSWVMSQLQPFLSEIWKNVDQTEMVNNLTNSLNDIATQLTGFAGNALGAIFSIFNGIFNLFLVLIVSFFMILHKEDTSHFFNSLFPSRHSAYINAKLHQVNVRIGKWVRGQVLLAISMGLLTLVIFWIIGIKYALTLALLSGIAEFIPYLGPLITFGSALLIALNQDPILALWLIPAYFVIQFIEGNIFVPLIIGKSVGLNPIVILFAMLAGASIGTQLGGSFVMGLLGMMMAVPTANIVSIFIEDYTEKNK